MASAADRLKIARSIVDFETRRNPNGLIQIRNLSAADDRGRFEVAGINERYHPAEAAYLARLIGTGSYRQAEAALTEIIATITDSVNSWSTVTAIESYLRDIAFHRGNRAAAQILQMALGVGVDGVVGDSTRDALRIQEVDPEGLLHRLRATREHYEREVIRRPPSYRFWRGLIKRWDDSLDVARSFLNTGENTVSPPLAAIPESIAQSEVSLAASSRDVVTSKRSRFDSYLRHEIARYQPTADHGLEALTEMVVEPRAAVRLPILLRVNPTRFDAARI